MSSATIRLTYSITSNKINYFNNSIKKDAIKVWITLFNNEGWQTVFGFSSFSCADKIMTNLS